MDMMKNGILIAQNSTMRCQEAGHEKQAQENQSGLVCGVQ